MREERAGVYALAFIEYANPARHLVVVKSNPPFGPNSVFPSAFITKGSDPPVELISLRLNAFRDSKTLQKD